MLLLGVVVVPLLDVAVLLGVVVVLLDVAVLLDIAVLLGVNDRVAIHIDKLIATLQGKTLNTTSMAVLSTAVKTLNF